MQGAVSQATVRLTMYRIEETVTVDWLPMHILGVHVTVTPLYSHRNRADIC
jgi:hypothetical protein